jgi:hypothetical protein
VDVASVDHRCCVTKHLLSVVHCMDQPRASAAVARASRYMTESANVFARLSAVRASIVGGRWAHPYRDARYWHGHSCGQRLQSFARAALGGCVHALDERNGFFERDRACPWVAQVTTHCPRSFVVIAVCRQTAGKIKASTIKEISAWGTVTITGELPCSATPTIAICCVVPVTRGSWP